MSFTNGDASRWIFSPEKLRMTPSIRNGMTQQDELAHRQTAAYYIRSIGLKLRESCKRPSGLSINTAMVFMHRFYVFHSFQKYSALTMAPCALFLAAKVEETPIKLEYVIKTAHMIQNPKAPPLTDKMFEELQHELIINENLLLQTLGFDMILTHPHASVITCAEMFGAPKTLIKLAYELATNSLHFTTMCLKYEPAVIACICLNIALKKFSMSIDRSADGKDWWHYLSPQLNEATVSEMTNEFIAIIEKCKKAFNKWLTVKNQQPEGMESRSSTSGSTTNITTTIARATGSTEIE